jgi:hypothetical protein
MTELIAETLANPIIGAAGTALVLAAVALWLAGAWWAHADAARRTESSLAGYVAAGWILLSTPLLLPLSLAAYAFARPQVSAADQRTKALARELGTTVDPETCASCAAPVDAAWVRCPACTAWLASPCSHCGSWSDRTLEICPWCGSDTREAPFVEQLGEMGPASQRTRRRRLAWRAASPSVPRSQQRDGVRPALAPGAPRAASLRVHL